MAYNVEGARQSGYSDDEIADFLSRQMGFDAEGARKSGYSSAEIIRHLSPANATIRAKQQAKDAAAGGGVVERFGLGVAGGVQSLGQGLQRLGNMATLGAIPDVDPVRMAETEGMLEGAGTAGTVGRTATDLVTALVPGLGVTRALRAAGPAARTAGAMAEGAITSAAQNPTDMGAAALIGGAMPGIITGAGRLLGGAARPAVTAGATPEATRLAGEGIPVPAWKMTADEGWRARIERLSALPMTGAAIKSAERDAIRAWNEKLVQRATPPAPVTDEAGAVLRWVNQPVKGTGEQAVRELVDRFDKAYGAVYKGRTIPLDADFANELRATLRSAKNFYPSIAGDVQGAHRQVMELLKAQSPDGHSGVTNAAVKQAIDVLDSRISTAYKQGNGDLADHLDAIRSAISDVRQRGLPPEVAESLRDVNGAYTTFKQLQRAHAYIGSKREDLVSPRQVLSAIRANDRSPDKSGFARGNLPNQQAVQDADRVLGSDIPAVGPGTAEKSLAAQVLSNPLMFALDAAGTVGLGTRPGQRLLFGDYGWQGKLRDLLAAPRDVVPQLSNQMRPGQTAAQLMRALLPASVDY